MFGALGADKYHEYCRDIRQSGQYLLDVINDVLDMSKIEAGRLKLDAEDVELDRILADAMRVVSRARTGKAAHPLLTHRAGHHVQGRPARAQADRAQSSVECGEIHAGRTAASRCAGGATSPASPLRSAIPASASRKDALQEARPAVRASRKPIDQDPSRLGPRPCDRKIARRVAWRHHAHPLQASARARSSSCGCRPTAAAFRRRRGRRCSNRLAADCAQHQRFKPGHVPVLIFTLLLVTAATNCGL